MTCFIDEYDRFANQLLVENIEKYRAIIKGQSGVPSSSVLRSFLGTLKSIGGSQEMRSFITGIMPLALADASGYNVAKNITQNAQHGSWLAFATWSSDWRSFLT